MVFCDFLCLSGSFKMEEGGQIISMDGNFGLVRKKSGGQSKNEPKFKGMYFLDQNTVEEYLEQLPEVKTKISVSTVMFTTHQLFDTVIIL